MDSYLVNLALKVARLEIKWKLFSYKNMTPFQMQGVNMDGIRYTRVWPKDIYSHNNNKKTVNNNTTVAENNSEDD